MTDIGQNHRVLKIVPPEYEGDRTRYYLENLRSERKIEVYVLKQYLEEVKGITFRARTENELY